MPHWAAVLAYAIATHLLTQPRVPRAVSRQFTVLDARKLFPDVNCVVVEDACCGVTSAGVQDAFRKFSLERVALIESTDDKLRDLPPYKYCNAQSLSSACLR